MATAQLRYRQHQNDARVIPRALVGFGLVLSACSSETDVVVPSGAASNSAVTATGGAPTTWGVGAGGAQQGVGLAPGAAATGWGTGAAVGTGTPGIVTAVGGAAESPAGGVPPVGIGATGGVATTLPTGGTGFGMATGGTATGGTLVALGGTPTTQATGGTPMATGGMPNDPFAADPVCTSGTFWTEQNGEGPSMRPGEACIACHMSDEGPIFEVAGTVYPSGHEPDDCNGAGASGAVVVITDAQGMVYELEVNGAGNFSLENVTIALPYTAKVVQNGMERAMSGSQTSGDCNSCHTQQGSSSAPGRIVLP